MGFFANFWATLQLVLNNYIAANAAAVARVLEPTLFTCGVIYVMIWGYLQMTGKMEEPLVIGLKRILLLGLVFAVSAQLWVYHSVITAFFYAGPTEFAQAVFGAREPVGVIDSIWSHGSHVAENLLARGGILDGWGFTVAAFAVWIFVGWLCVYTMYLIAFSKVALAVLLAIGPLFLILLLFDQTRDYFLRWLGQLSYYAMVTILTIMAALLFLQIVDVYAQKTAARGAAVLTMDALDMILISVLAVFFMMQIMSVAAGLSGGHGLNMSSAWQRAYSTWGRLGGLGLGLAAAPLRGMGRFTHGAFMDRDLQPGDTLGRRLGKRAGNAVGNAARALRRRENIIKPA